MKCLHPIKAYYNEKEREIRFKSPFSKEGKKGDLNWQVLELPCGQCEACKITHAREWSARIYKEYQETNKGAFITLTYNENAIPKKHGIETLLKSDIQKFIKRLRHHFKDKKIKYYATGEYGTKLGRPHYHIILLGITPEDLATINHNSRILKKVWPFGINYTTHVNEATIAYTTRYTLKKIKEVGNDYYKKIGIEAPFNLQSKKLGENFYIKQKEKLIKENGYFYINGKMQNLAKYYYKKYEEDLKKAKEIKKEVGKFYANLKGDLTEQLKTQQKIYKKLSQRK